MSEVRIVLVDDHTVLRTGLRMVISGQPDLTVVGEAADGPEALLVVRRVLPDVVVLDLALPGTDAMELIAEVVRSSPGTQVLILTMHADAGSVRAALTAGARGYIVKTTAHTELLRAIRSVHAGRTVVDPSLTPGRRRAGEPPRPAAGGRGQLLSPRERQVLQLLAHGHTHQEIADRLGVGIKSIETYRARLARKLDLQSRADLVRYAIGVGLLQTEPVQGRPPPTAR